MKALTLLIALLLVSGAAAHTVITETDITLHSGDVIPRFAVTAARRLVVPAGETATISGDWEFDAIEVSGTLIVSRTQDTTLRFVNLQVLPGGVLDMGTPADPILRHVEFIVRNVPISAADPYQWGNGIFNLGTWTACGRSMRTWARMESTVTSQSLRGDFRPPGRVVIPGITSQMLVLVDPVDWEVGDELLVPDTRQCLVFPWTEWPHTPIFPRRESPVSVTGIGAGGMRILLSKSLDFEHLSAMSPPLLPNGDFNRDGKVDTSDRTFWENHQGETSGVGLQADGNHDGTVDQADLDIWQANQGRTSQRVERFKPFIANMTRNIVIRSENPQGVRGHTVSTGDDAIQQLSYVAFLGLGRTTSETLNNAHLENGIVVPGTNQVGKYPVHFHHVHTAGNYVRGLAIDGTDVAKWGLSVHGTSDVTVDQCVVNRCVGAGLVTEDGPEVRNDFTNNFVMGCTGNPYDPGAKNALDLGRPGYEGAGIWMHGAYNRVSGNVCCNNSIGITFMGWVVANYNYPSVPGGPLDTPYEKFVLRTPIECADNVTFSNLTNGLDSWFYVPDVTNLESWHNGFAQVGGEEGSGIFLRNSKLLADGWGTVAIHSNPGYVGFVEIYDSLIEGCAEGVQPVIQAIGHYTVQRSTLFNQLNFNWISQDGGAMAGFPVNVNCLAVPAVNGDPNFKCDWLPNQNPADNGPFQLNGLPQP